MEQLREFGNSNQEAAENRKEQAEVLLRFLHIANIESFHGQTFEAVFSDEQHKRELIENLSPEEFSDLLGGLNGVLRNKMKEDWKMDGKDVGVGGNVFTGLGYISPIQEDKPELLEKLLLSAKKMNKEGRNLKDIALIVSATINAIHPFLDGNGRTSRFLYSILAKAYNKEQIKIILSKSATFDGAEINIDPGLIKTKIDDLIETELGIANPEINTHKILGMRRSWDELEFKEGVEEKQKHLFLHLYEVDNHYLFLSIFKFFRDNPDIEKEKYLKQVQKGSGLLINSLMKDLNRGQVDQILQNYRELKKKYIEKLIGSIEDPDKKEYQVDVEGQKIPLKVYFENRIKEEQEKYNTVKQNE